MTAEGKLGGFVFMIFSEAVAKFRDWKGFNTKKNTVKGYDLILRQFGVFMGDRNIEEIKIEDVVRWFQLMRAFGWDSNSFIPRAIALRKFFEYFHLQGYKVIDPLLIPVPKKTYKIPRIARVEDYEKLLSVIPENNDPRHIRNKAIITLIWDTGMRNNECLSLDLSDVDINTRRVFIRTEKSQGVRPFRTLDWTDRTQVYLERWLEKRKKLLKIMKLKEQDALFFCICGVGAYGQSKSGERFTIKGVGEMLRRYSHKAELGYTFNAHSMRHAMGRDIIRAGGSNADVKARLGHSNLQSTDIYTQLFGEEAIERFQSLKIRK